MSAPDPGVEAFFARHCAAQGGVIMVEILDTDGSRHQIGIFADLAKAQAWADLPEYAGKGGALFVPFIINEPEFGNVPKEAQH